MSQSTEFKNGQEIEYQIKSEQWIRATYVGKYPTDEGKHVICTIGGVLYHHDGELIRIPKVKKEGWVNIYRDNSKDCNQSWAHAIYPTKEAARRVGVGRDYVDSVKVEWEE